jgi:hypothetical protein
MTGRCEDGPGICIPCIWALIGAAYIAFGAVLYLAAGLAGELGFLATAAACVVAVVIGGAVIEVGRLYRRRRNAATSTPAIEPQGEASDLDVAVGIWADKTVADIEQYLAEVAKR